LLTPPVSDGIVSCQKETLRRTDEWQYLNLLGVDDHGFASFRPSFKRHAWGSVRTFRLHLNMRVQRLLDAGGTDAAVQASPFTV